MTDLRKAAEMALEALMDANKFEYKDEIAALRQALAQDEQKLIGWKDGEPQYVAQPEQEPVAWLVSDAQGRYATIRDPAPYGEEVYEPLYTAPPKPEQEPKLSDAGVDTNIPLWGLEPKGSGMVMLHQREWVGLTNDEIQTQWNNACLDTVENPGWNRHIRFARTIEAKLKEKNT